MTFQMQKEIKINTLRKLEEMTVNEKRSTLASPQDKEQFYDRLH
jgi:hypothetical protein